MFVPFVALRFVDKLSLAETFATLGLDRRGFSLVLPAYLVLLALISLPYVKSVAPVIERWTRSVPLSESRITAFSKTLRKPPTSFPPVAVVRSEDVHARVVVK